MISHFFKIFLLGLVALLTACTSIRYEYYPPASEAGRQCVVQCSGVREMCVSNEMQRAQFDKNSCDQRNYWNFQNCMRRANDKDDRKACSRYQSTCWANPNTYRCDENYRSCYVMCGGQVLMIKEE